MRKSGLQKPSTRMQVSTANLIDARDSYRNDMDKHDVPWVQKQMFDVMMHTLFAMLERSDAVVELLEHLVVDHVCSEGHEPKTPDSPIDNFLKGIGPKDNPPEE